MNKFDLFDQKIRDAINKYEVPFDDTAWKNIENKINAKPAGKVINWKPWAMSAAAAAILFIGYFVIQPDAKPTIEHAEKKKVEISTPAETKLETKDDKELNSEPIKEENESADKEPKKESKKLITPTKTLPLIEEKNEFTQQTDDAVIEEKLEIEDLDIDLANETIISSDDEIVQLIIDIHISDAVICQNEVLSISLNSSNVPVEIVWDFGDGLKAEGPTAIHSYDEPGNYVLKLEARSVLDESLSETKSYTIKVDPIPDAQFEILKNENMASHPKVEFSTLENHFSSIEWKFKDGSVSSESLVNKMYHKKGVYEVGLVVKNQFQCSDTLYRSLVIKDDFNLLAPNAFSPNGDGINDTFMPKALSNFNKAFTLQIFDPKTSQLIFESHDFDNPWNGDVMNNGAKMNEGAFAWSVIIEDGSVYKGTILITAK